MKRFTIHLAAMAMLVTGVAACDSSIAGPETTTTPVVAIDPIRHEVARGIGTTPRGGFVTTSRLDEERESSLASHKVELAKLETAVR